MQQLYNQNNNLVKCYISHKTTRVLKGRLNSQIIAIGIKRSLMLMEYHTKNTQKVNALCRIDNDRIIAACTYN